MDHEWLVHKSDKRPKQKCVNNLTKLVEGNSNPISEVEASKLFNYVILYVMIDSRIIISESVVVEIKKTISLVQLVQADWLDIKSLIQIIRNVIDLKQPDYGGYFGEYRMTNLMFLDLVRERLTENAKNELGILGQTNAKLLKEMRTIYRYNRLKCMI